MGIHRKPTPTGALRAVVGSGAFAVVAPLATPGLAAAAEPLPAGPPGGWGPVIACESGGRTDATNSHSTASGALQFLDSTWLGLGGGEFAPRAKDATLAQQLQIAERAYARSGLSSWKASEHCWGGQIGKGKPAPRPAPKSEAKPAPATVPKPAPVPPMPNLLGAPLTPAPTPPPAATSPAAPADGYTVAPGETLTGIAAAHGLHTWQQLWDANRAVIADPNLIPAGLRITIPAP